MTKRTSKSSSNQSATATTAPNVPSWISGPAQGYLGQVSTLQRPGTYGATTNQQQAFTRAGGLTGDPNIATGLEGLRNVGQLSSTDLSPYYDPYQRDVIDATLADFNQGNELGLNALRASTPSGAFGGSRAAVAQGQLVGDNSRTLASTLAALRSGNFQQAQQAAQFDIGNRLGAAGQLLQGGLSADANLRANIGAQADLGATERGIAQENDPGNQQANYLNMLRQLLGFDPSQYIGQTVNSSGTSSSKSSQSGSPLDAIGQIMQIAAIASGKGI